MKVGFLHKFEVLMVNIKIIVIWDVTVCRLEILVSIFRVSLEAIRFLWNVDQTECCHNPEGHNVKIIFCYILFAREIS
jgi:hypothetical protein